MLKILRKRRSKSSFESLQNQVANSVAEGKSSAEILMPFLFDMQQQLAKMNNSVNDPKRGLKARVNTVTGDTEDNTNRIIQLEQENEMLRENQRIMIGLMQRMSDKLERMYTKVENLIVRSMQQNFVIHNHEFELAEGEPAWDLRPIVEEFLQEKLGMSVNSREIFVAHKLGEESIVARVDPALKNEVFNRVGRLQGQKNSKNKDIYITDQQPEGPRARRMYAKELQKEIIANNQHLPKDQRPKVEVKQDRVYVNKDLRKNTCPAPKPIDVLDVEPEERKMIDKIKFAQCEERTEKGSSFRGLCAKASNRVEIRRAYKKARIMFPGATHIMAGYAYKQSKDRIEYGRDDDGEWGGSHRIVEAIKSANASNVVVFVIRQYGGEHLGGSRFKHIKACAEKALEEIGVK